MERNPNLPWMSCPPQKRFGQGSPGKSRGTTKQGGACSAFARHAPPCMICVFLNRPEKPSPLQVFSGGKPPLLRRFPHVPGLDGDGGCGGAHRGLVLRSKAEGEAAASGEMARRGTEGARRAAPLQFSRETHAVRGGDEERVNPRNGRKRHGSPRRAASGAGSRRRLRCGS
jgi:hypothetical protein